MHAPSPSRALRNLLTILLPTAAVVGCAVPPAAPASEAPALRVTPVDLAAPPAAFTRLPDGWAAEHAHWSARFGHGLLRVTVGASAVTVRSGDGDFTAASPGVLARPTGEAVEEWVDGEGALEQRWRFARAPGPPGERTFGLSVDGARCEADGDAGVVLSVNGAAALRYSHGTWVDAEGRRTPVPARCAGGGVALTVPAALLAASRYPAVLDPTVTPVALGALAPVNEGMDVPARFSMADNGRVVVIAHRYFARVDHTGRVLDPAPRPEQPFRSDEWEDPPASLFTVVRRFGTGFLTITPAWTSALGGVDHLLRRLDEDGLARDEPVAVLRTTNSGALTVADASCDAAGCLVALATESRSALLRRVGPDGRAVDAPAVSLGPNVTEAAVGTAATGWLVAWTDTSAGPDNPEVRVARVGRSGALLDPGGRTISTIGLQRSGASVASDGTNFFVAWIVRSFGLRPTGAYGVLLGPDGAALTPTILLGEGAIAANPSPVSVAFDGVRYVATWARPGSTGLARISPTGALLDATPQSIAAASSASQVAGDGGEALVALTAGTVSGYWLRATGALGPSIPLARYPDAEADPLVVWNGREFLLGRSGSTPDRVSLVGGLPQSATRFVTEDGVARTAWAPVGVAQGYRFTAGAFDGTRVHLAGSRYALVAADGAATPVTSTLPTVVDLSSARGAVGHVAVGAFTPGMAASMVQFRRVGPDGVSLDPSPLSVMGTAGCSAFDGQSWFVFVYTNDRRLQLYRLSAAGEILAAPQTIPGGDLISQATTMHAACGGGACAVVTLLRRSAVATVVSRDGSVRGSVVLAESPTSEMQDRSGGVVSFDGHEFVITLRTRQPATLLARRLRPDGTLVDPAGQAVFANAYDMRECSQDSSPNGRTLVACRGWDRAWPVHRLYAAILRADGSDGGVSDAGTGPVDVGNTPVDAGSTSVDVGSNPVDVGTGPVDAGSNPVDIGNTPVDAGSPPASDGGCAVGAVGTSGRRAPLDVGAVGLSVLALVGARRRRRRG